ncbi:unnamed protein product, partial [Rotaria sp. Silwood2]
MVLHLHKQQVTYGVPQTIQYYHGREEAPKIGVLKTYQAMGHPMYYVLYIQDQSKIINITSTPTECPNALSLLHG